MKSLFEYINESMTGWKESADSLVKTIKRGSVIIFKPITTNNKGTKYSVLLKYDGYSGGVMDRIDNLTKDEAIKQGEEFLKNPKKYFDEQ